jgi:hypothetical protein
MTANVAASIRFALDQHRPQVRAVLVANLRGANAKIVQHVHHRVDIARIAPGSMGDPQRAEPVPAVCEHHDLVRLNLWR